MRGYPNEPRAPLRLTSVPSLRRSGAPGAAILLLVLVVTGCSGPQSALDTAGRGAERIAELSIWLAVGGGLVWLFVVALSVFVTRISPRAFSERRAKQLIVGGGVIFPVIILAVYLVYGLALLPELVRPAPPGSVQISVTGHQWWWRVRYLTADGEAIELANELHLPVGEPVDLLLDSPDVIHSFWIPSIGGKMDMIPGRVNRLALHPTRVGVFRGACAEYCGASHALMKFYAVVEEPEEFARWLAHQASPARPPETPRAREGERVFLASGCGACHAVRGTPADGRMGPDLTHVGSRLSLGAGILPNEPAEFAAWIAQTDEIKPDVHMPAFGMLASEEIEALAAYLEGLE